MKVYEKPYEPMFYAILSAENYAAHWDEGVRPGLAEAAVRAWVEAVIVNPDFKEALQLMLEDRARFVSEGGEDDGLSNADELVTWIGTALVAMAYK
jgi:hypothetical protein